MYIGFACCLLDYIGSQPSLHFMIRCWASGCLWFGLYVNFAIYFWSIDPWKISGCINYYYLQEPQLICSFDRCMHIGSLLFSSQCLVAIYYVLCFILLAWEFSCLTIQLTVLLLPNLLADRYRWHFLKESRKILPRNTGEEKLPLLLPTAWVKNLGNLLFLSFPYTCSLYVTIWQLILMVRHPQLRPKLKEQMQYCVDHPEEVSKLSKVKAQVSEVKGVMMENIEKVKKCCSL